ncbi:MAG: hypothetical protein AB8G77_13290 [Rhodothermales bacterium]
MGNNKILIAGLVGGIVSFLTGFLIWGIALASFAEANAGPASGVTKEGMDFWAIILGSLAGGMMIAVIFGRWAHIKTAKTGATAGALIGILIGININFIMFGTTFITTLPLAIVDSIAYAVLYAIIGAVVGLMLGKGVPALEEAVA